ncbi:MAG: bifunctional UDP-3-O-[3-hydroxymyristoyl] N-acetylglucosamine deacetylase/3-hydroxyacyl-ACP dehydratase [Rikenellaceae bacterium]|nr:bifunctional UDP-3-O-[3-hydroxymyristoyl] N-acetylglucosamine deacetylase/3-hydroxyacyl-ACP dehydratase [Rikenellaceae bacterium]
MSKKQMTLARMMKFQGKGLHTGVKVEMTVNPAEENTGIRFQRVDLDGEPVVEALVDYVTDTSRGTTIEKNGVRIHTIEHIMAALWGSGIDNALIQLNGEEVPIMDGSAREYVKEIMNAGIIEQNTDRIYFNLTEKVHFEIPEKGVSIEIFPDDHFSVNLNIDYGSRVLGNQYAKLENLGDFPVLIAPCRTFVFLHELESLLKNNLIKGGDLDNAIIIVENELPQNETDRLKKLFNKEDINVVASGYLNNLELRFANEPARHKLLDMIGDMALVGMRINGKVIAHKPGHFANTELARLLRKTIKKNQTKPKRPYNPNVEPVYDINQIKSILPHRPPFLLVDKITHIDAASVSGIKNVTMNEPFFVGHFPEEPVMPGVLIVEAMAQCGGILALHSLEDPENYSTYFMKIDGVKFKRKVVPGDTLLFELKLTEPIRRGIVMMEAKAYVGDQLAAEAFLMAQVAKNKK